MCQSTSVILWADSADGLKCPILWADSANGLKCLILWADSANGLKCPSASDH